ncbi:ADP-glyceromanno-heptose 6-epimerase [Bdellovibrionota bacterium FG-1]
MSQTKPLFPMLVTGAAGFIGSTFVRSCADQGRAVISVDRRSHFADRPEHQDIDFGTIIDRDELFSWLDNAQPRLSAIVHIGACSNTTETDEAFLRRNNVEYSQRLWEYARIHKLPFVYASSAATYGDGSLGYDDDESRLPALQPLNLYGCSKHLFDIWALEQEQKGQHPPIWSGFKFFNVYGFGERHKKAMASVILHAFDQLQATGKLKLFRSHRTDILDGHQSRDFVHVDDVVKVLHFALEKPILRGIYNLGTGQARTFLDLGRAVFSALEIPEQIEFIDTPLQLRDKYQYFTEARMNRLRAQGYAQPFIPFEKGTQEYIGRLKKQLH